MPNRNKQRGNELEREVVAAFLAQGMTAERAWGSNGRALGEAETVDVVGQGCKIQCKRRKRLPAYLALPEACDAVAFRQDRGPIMCLIPLATLVQLIESAGGF